MNLPQDLGKAGGLPLRVFLTLHWHELLPESERPSASIIGSVAGSRQPEDVHASAASSVSREAGAFPLLTCDRMKMFMDGSLGAETAALSVPYVPASAVPDGSAVSPPPHDHGPGDAGCSAGQPSPTENRGVLYHTLEEATAAMKLVTERGYRLEVHIIGDAAAEMALDALEVVRARCSQHVARLRPCMPIIVCRCVL